jgi:hypothetical protein
VLVLTKSQSLQQLKRVQSAGLLKNQALVNKTFQNKMENIIDLLIMMEEMPEELSTILIGNTHHMDTHNQLQTAKIQNKEAGMTDAQLTSDTQIFKIDSNQQKESVIIMQEIIIDATTINHLVRILTVQGNTKK